MKLFRGFFVASLCALGAGCMTGGPRPHGAPVTTVRFEPVKWSKLPGWKTDDTLAAWPAIVSTCGVMGKRAEWQSFCGAVVATSPMDAGFARSFLEQQLTPYRVLRVTGRKREPTGLVTGYFEPLLHGARERSGQYATPLYSPPADLLTVELASLFPELKGKRVRGRLEGNKVVPYYTRAATREAPGLAGHELVWIDNPLDAFMLEIQGSGRVQLSTGETIRLQYADQNGQPYRSIGRYLADQGVMTIDQVNMPAIRAWLAANPARVNEVLDSNPSVVFFSEEAIADPSIGPRGAQGVPLTAGRSIAIDPKYLPLGAPVFLSTTQPGGSNLPLQRLVVAQDTGGAIRGPIRADLFFGFGAEAGTQAGMMKYDGEMWLLWPRDAPPP
ncbi:MAG TPA: MltA domain-containing protein [Steroidobacteraceae bacterium]|nr:MltA domain-containing protein [Steroidobacteraceae bacterium]